MTGGQCAVELRERQRAEWSAAAPAWQPDPATPVAAADPVTQRLPVLARVAPGQRARNWPAAATCASSRSSIGCARRWTRRSWRS